MYDTARSMIGKQTYDQACRSPGHIAEAQQVARQFLHVHGAVKRAFWHDDCNSPRDGRDLAFIVEHFCMKCGMEGEGLPPGLRRYRGSAHPLPRGTIN